MILLLVELLSLIRRMNHRIQDNKISKSRGCRSSENGGAATPLVFAARETGREMITELALGQAEG